MADNEFFALAKEAIDESNITEFSKLVSLCCSWFQVGSIDQTTHGDA